VILLTANITTFFKYLLYVVDMRRQVKLLCLVSHPDVKRENLY